MWRLFEGGYYSKCRRRGYYLFQLYRNAATIRGRLLFEVQTSRLLFISALPQCGDYSRAATIMCHGYYLFQRYRNAATIRGWLLFEGGYYSKYRCRGYYLFQRYRNAATIRGWLLFEGGYYSKYRRRGYYLFQLYRNAATIRGRLLLCVMATIYFSATAMRLLFEGGYYSRAATIRGNTVYHNNNT